MTLGFAKNPRGRIGTSGSSICDEWMALGTAIDETRGRIASRCRHGPSSRPTPRSLPFHPAPVRGQGPQGDERQLLSHMDITGRQIRRTGIHPSEPLRSRTAEDGFGSTAAVQHLRKSVRLTPASRPSARSRNRRFRAKSLVHWISPQPRGRSWRL